MGYHQRCLKVVPGMFQQEVNASQVINVLIKHMYQHTIVRKTESGFWISTSCRRTQTS